MNGRDGGCESVSGYGEAEEERGVWPSVCLLRVGSGAVSTTRSGTGVSLCRALSHGVVRLCARTLTAIKTTAERRLVVVRENSVLTAVKESSVGVVCPACGVCGVARVVTVSVRPRVAIESVGMSGPHRTSRVRTPVCVK